MSQINDLIFHLKKKLKRKKKEQVKFKLGRTKEIIKIKADNNERDYYTKSIKENAGSLKESIQMIKLQPDQRGKWRQYEITNIRYEQVDSTYNKFDNLDEMGKSLRDENYQSLLKKKYLT